MKAEVNSERAIQDLHSIKDRLDRLQDGRKKDIEETADFIKTVLNQTKADFEKDVSRLIHECEVQRRDLAEKCAVTELLELKAKVMAALEVKVDLKEV